jgi:DNA-binding IscR family transcriptional regulator
MPKISQQKKDRIAEQILHYLFSSSPQPLFTAQIASEIARDEEFTLSLLSSLKSKGLVLEVNKNNSGTDYIRRKRWIISPKAYEAYKKHQH